MFRCSQMTELACVDKSWLSFLEQWDLDLDNLYSAPPEVYPPREHVFAAFSLPVDKIRVVLLGQDPYHGHGQAHGYSFSVPQGVDIPPSLRNIFKEIVTEYPERGYKFAHGNLEQWSTREGIMLLNATLTVPRAQPNAHIKQWKDFTTELIEYIAERNKTCVFLLLGNPAKKRGEKIPASRKVEGVHPSPLSAHGGFFDSGIFLRVEEKVGMVNWQN